MKVLEGRVAIVTGAGRNIGRAIALQLAQDGASVVINVRSNKAEADKVAAEVQAAGGKAAEFVRVFPVPGMAHCGGGPATDMYDCLTAIVDWVEHGKAPDRILAHAGASTPWPRRTRPLCPYPMAARYAGAGSVDSAASFVCR